MPQAGDQFGRSVAISGDTAIVGAPLEDGGLGDPISDAGAVYVFQFFEGFGWFWIEKRTASDAQADDNFGVSVAISGDTAIVGAPREDGGAGNPLMSSGAAYVFRESFLRFFIGARLLGPLEALVGTGTVRVE